jgi:hypothetical protein
VKTEALHNLGGFSSVRGSIMPEATFARRLHPTDLYRFSVSDGVVGISTEKKWSSQLETAVRIIYPICKRQPILIFATLVALASLLVPYIYTAWAMLTTEPPEQVEVLLVALATIASIVLSLGYALYLRMSSPKVWPVGLVAFPLLVLQEILLSVVSMIQYEFGEVNWKGRNVCYPVINPPKGTEKPTAKN